MLPETCEELSEMLSSVEERYSWSKGKMLVKRFLCIFFLLLTMSIYVFDKFTDVEFSEEMHRNSMNDTNFTLDIQYCKLALSTIVDNITKFCQSDKFDVIKCAEASNALETALAGKCSEVEAKLDSGEWMLARWAILAHVISPDAFIFTFALINIDMKMLRNTRNSAEKAGGLLCHLLSGVVCGVAKFFHKENVIQDAEEGLCLYCFAFCIVYPLVFIIGAPILLISFICHFFWSLPLPFLAKIKQTMIEWYTFKLFTKRAEMDKAEFDKKMEEQKDKEEEILKAEIFSIVAETGLESNFQFWFQTQYILSMLVANILDYTNDLLDITDLFNWRTFSVLISFVSISWTAVKIRYPINKYLTVSKAK